MSLLAIVTIQKEILYYLYRMSTKNLNLDLTYHQANIREKTFCRTAVFLLTYPITDVFIALADKVKVFCRDRVMDRK